MRKLSAAIGRPVTFALTQNDHDPDAWCRMLDLCAEAARRGCAGPPAGRGPAGDACCSGCRRSTRSRTARRGRRSARAPLAGEGRGDARPRAARGACSAEVDDAIAADAAVPRPRACLPAGRDPRLRARTRRQHRRASTRAEPAARWTSTTTPCSPTTATHSSCARCSTTPTSPSTPSARCSMHPTSAWGLGDGGAHCGTTCDASTPTFMLTHWARDRAHDQLPLEWVVRKMTTETACALRPRRPRRARAGQDRRRQRHRLRRTRTRRVP